MSNKYFAEWEKSQKSNSSRTDSYKISRASDKLKNAEKAHEIFSKASSQSNRDQCFGLYCNPNGFGHSSHQVMMVGQSPSPQVIMVGQSPSPQVMMIGQSPSPQVMMIGQYPPQVMMYGGYFL